MKKDLLTLTEFSKEEVEAILGQASAFKEALKQGKEHQLLEGKVIALIFEKPSTRTRVSFEAAIFQLGAYPVALGASEMQLGRGETVSDTGRVLSRYVQAIVIRTFAQETLEEMAAAASVPVINALSDEHHPCQALADLMTIREKKGRLPGLRLAYLGDGNNVCHSLLLAGATVGLNVSVASPPEYAPKAEIVDLAKRIAAKSGSKIRVLADADEAAGGADVLYTDVWVSMGEEAEASARKQVLKPYQLNEARLALAGRDALVMHCLPAHKGEEITEGVFESPNAVVFDQAENRLHTAKALLVELLGRGNG